MIWLTLGFLCGLVMGMLFAAYLKREEARKKSLFTVDRRDLGYPTDEEVQREIIKRAANTGKIIIANRMEDGSVEYQEQEGGIGWPDNREIDSFLEENNIPVAVSDEQLRESRLWQEREATYDCLLLVLEEKDDAPDLIGLTEPELVEIQRWCGLMMAEASDNDVRAEGAPECLRRLLPKEHYLQTWRINEKV